MRATTVTMENKSHMKYSLVSWKAVIAGAFIALFTYSLFVALGVGIGGLRLQGIVGSAEGGTSLAIGSAIWLVISSMIALFVGAYFATRLFNLSSKPAGIGQGLVLAAVFFVAMAFGAGAIIMGAASGVGATVSSIGGIAQNINLSNNAMTPVQQFTDRALANVELKAPSDEIAAGLFTRLVRGDLESAKAYLARQTSLSRAQIDSYVTQLGADVREASDKVAGGVSAAGWMAFTILLLGGIAASIGGLVGAHGSAKSPWTDTATTRDSLASSNRDKNLAA